MHIAREAREHEDAIRALLVEAFPTSLEADLVDRLRADGDIAAAHVAREAGEVVGYVALSPLAAPMRALGLGPLAVAPRLRRHGIGKSLVTEALEQATNDAWEAVFVLGDPAYYGRFGFSAADASRFETPYAGPYFMALALNASGLRVRTGHIGYAPAFRDLA